MRISKPARPPRPSDLIRGSQRALEPHPQPLAEAGEQRPEYVRDEEELDAVSAWLAHVKAGRIPTV